MPTLTPRFAISTLAITFSLLTGSHAFAASACKGQADTSCNQNDSCYWVTGYKRSDGVNVKGHCRAKPQSSIKDSAMQKTKNKPADMKTTANNKEKPEANLKTTAKSISPETEKNMTTIKQ
mgnify:FL=1